MTRAAARLIALAAAVALAAPAGAAQAQRDPLEKAGWTLVTSSDDTLVYMKPAPSTAGDKLRRVWTAYDSARPLQRGGLTFRSVKSLGEFDCGKKLSRVLEETFHEAPGLQSEGRKIAGWVPTDWQPVEPGSVGAIRMAYACETTGTI